MDTTKIESEEATNEFEFQKIKGFGAANFVWHTTKVVIEETSLSVEHKRKILFFNSKPNHAVVNYNDLDKVELKTHFTMGDLISGIIIGIIGIATMQIWALIFTALLVLFAYSKNIVIIRKGGSKVTILNGSFISGGRMDEFNRMIPMLTTKLEREVYVKHGEKAQTLKSTEDDNREKTKNKLPSHDAHQVFCGNCGAKVVASEKFCGSCGKALNH